MPFDSKSFVEVVPDQGVANLQYLAWLLRHKEYWPTGFVWDYSKIGSCAIGLYHETTGVYPTHHMFGMTQPEWNGIYCGVKSRSWLRRFFGQMSHVRASDVAYAIEKHLSNH